MRVQTLETLKNADIPPPISGNQDEVMARIGYMTRILHDSLRGLGLDKALEEVTHEIPDARDRLNYVVRMTEQAAQKVLNATDAAMPMQEIIADSAQSLAAEWKAVIEKPGLKHDYNAMAEKTLAFLEDAEKNANASKALMMEIMMAQDFQDLTGQVIKRVTELAQELEQHLVQVLIDFNPANKKEDDGLLNGPQINAEANVNAVSGQEQVDDLLASLGF
jgi:chemotaxis protein CheZ